MTQAQQQKQANRFLLLYALAAAGGAISYTPFITLLLPVRITAMVGSGDIEWLAYATFFGALASSGGNILFGWLSDKSGVRTPWIVAGLVLSSLLLLSFSLVDDIRLLVLVMIVWQLAVNMMLAPLTAWAGDCVPDVQKGTLGGLLSLSPALGALSAAFVTLPGLAGPDGRLWLVAGLVAAFVLPALLYGRPRPFPDLMDDTGMSRDAGHDERSATSPFTVARMWLARLLIQISEAALFAYLYFWFRTVDPVMTDARVAQIFSVILVVSVPVALTAGRWADRVNRPFLPLPVAAVGAAVGLLLMALSDTLLSAMIGYVVFGVSASVFLAIHGGQTLRVLPRPSNRGRDLGLFNLTNTTPSLVMPWLTLALVPVFGFSGLFFALTICAALAALLLLTLPRPL
ncbi:MFS transporter [Aurantiacibacter xanthus]|uniref:MFS transporter n=1 Tax=Aurantiacibacter xanthus TaxID=1784712 RepID=A0A3A1P5B9_9SPHN|nr:MFS transporter [Aurantiacibacter xanthus]RIV82310.1 MFS transporter [Aurantiacibacter xanthus]